MNIRIGKRTYKPSQIRKAIVAGIGAGVLLANDFVATFTSVIPAQVSAGITAVAGVATLVGVFLTKNAPLIDASDSLGE